MKSFIDKHVLPALRSPTNLLMVTGQAIFILCVGRVLTDILPTMSSMATEVLLRVSFSNLTGAAFIYALMSAFIALVYRIEGRPRPIPKENESITDKINRYMQDPEAAFRVAMWATLAFGTLTVIAMIVEISAFPDGIRLQNEVLFREFFARVWQHLIGGMLVLFGAKAIVEAVQPVPKIAPSGGAEDEEENKAAGKTSDSEDENSGDSPSFMDRYNSYFENPRAVLKVGGFVLVYLAFAVMIAQLWFLRDIGSTNQIIGTISIWMLLAVASGLVPMLFVWTIDQLNGRQSTSGENAPNRISEIVDRFRKPELALPLITWTMLISGGLWLVITMWGTRNDNAGEFWAFVFTNFVLFAAIMSIPLMAWSLWLAYVQKEPYTGFASGLMDNPVKLSTVLIFVLVYSGFAMTILNTWHVRIWGPADAWFILIQDLTNFGITVAILIGVRAVASAYEKRRDGVRSA